MKRICFTITIIFILILSACTSKNNDITVSGELRQWHKITLTADGPMANERDTLHNPFLDYRMTVTFKHESGSPVYTVPGYFAADGNAAETSAQSGNKWRAHLSPDKTGFWYYEITILSADNIAVNDDSDNSSSTVLKADGRFNVMPSNKSDRDFRGKGRLQYVGKRYLQFAGNKEFFLKAGADSPENLLAYADFDSTYSNKNVGLAREGEAATANLKTWSYHVRDWQSGDPVWKGNKGKGLIGALNYLAGTGCNSFSFLTYNAGGDGDDVWPFLSRDNKFHYDCSKLDQWQIIFDHAQKLGLYLHFKLQETENDDNTSGKSTIVPTSLDGGDLGIERKLYLRELIARFGYELALNWNLGEENTQTSEQQKSMAKFIRDTDPYMHHIVLHTYPNRQDTIYNPLLGNQSLLTGISLQNPWSTAHQRVVYWIDASEKAGKPWVVANDEQNPANNGVPPDRGYNGFDGVARPDDNGKPYTMDDIRKNTLWGVLMAGGGGVEYYFGYKLLQNDLNCEDWRSRDQSWEYCGIALDFFKNNKIPFWDMNNADDLVGNPLHNNSRYCLAKSLELYVIYLPDGGTTELDLSNSTSSFMIEWFNPREGGVMQAGSVKEITGPGKVLLGNPPAKPGEDWVVVVRKFVPGSIL